MWSLNRFDVLEGIAFDGQSLLRRLENNGLDDRYIKGVKLQKRDGYFLIERKRENYEDVGFETAFLRNACVYDAFFRHRRG